MKRTVRAHFYRLLEMIPTTRTVAFITSTKYHDEVLSVF